LDAEVAGKSFSVDTTANMDEQLQANLFRQQVAQYNSKVRSFDEDINRNSASIKTTEADRSLLIKQLSVAQDVENTRSNLLESKTGTKLQYLESQAGRVRAERDLADTVNRLVELQHGLQSLRAQRQGYIDDWNRQLFEELSKTRSELAKVEENINKATRMNDLVVLTAPEDGVVTEVAKRAEGSVINGGEPLVTMVPAHTPLVAEIAITSGDVGYVKIGDFTQIKVDAFPYQRYGRLRGHLAAISQESFGGGQKEDQRASMGFSETSTIAGGAVHKARIELEDQTLQNLPEGVHLIPGMTLLAEIKVGTRSIISYFLNPITRGLGESVKEP
jgi:HlyD family secretion protein